MRTDEATVALVRRLAAHYSDAVIAGILNRQGRTSAHGHRFAANISAISAVAGRSSFDPPATPQQGELVNVRQAATIRGVASSTIHRWLNDGLIPGEQLTLAAPWRVRVIDELRARFVDEPGEGYVTVQEATRRLGIFRQTVSTAASWGRSTSDVRQKGLRMKMIEDHPGPVPACLMNQRAI